MEVGSIALRAQARRRANRHNNNHQAPPQEV